MFFNLMDNIRRNRKNVSTRAYLSRIYIRILICDFFFFLFFKEPSCYYISNVSFEILTDDLKLFVNIFISNRAANRN